MGEIINVYKSHKLLTRDIVLCCTTTNNSDIYIDSFGSSKKAFVGDVVSISRDGTIQRKYNGNHLINSGDHHFRPIEVLSTKSKKLSL